MFCFVFNIQDNCSFDSIISWKSVLWVELYHPKFICWNSNRQSLRMWLYLETGSFQVKLRSLGWALIQQRWCPYIKGRFVADILWGWRWPGLAKKKNLGWILPSPPSEETNPADIYFGLLASRIMRINFCYWSIPLVVLCFGKPSKLIQFPEKFLTYFLQISSKYKAYSFFLPDIIINFSLFFCFLILMLIPVNLMFDTKELPEIIDLSRKILLFLIWSFHTADSLCLAG